MVTEKQLKELHGLVSAMPERTKAQRIRKANAWRHYYNIPNDDGAIGRIKDILSKSENSTILNFSKQNQADCFIWVDGSRYKAERKTNGGRIGELYGKKAPKFVVYSMDICNSGTANLRRVVEPIVLTTVDFIALLEKCKATKSTNGKNPEVAIQVTSKALYLELLQITTTYTPTARYTAEELNFKP